LTFDWSFIDFLSRLENSVALSLIRDLHTLLRKLSHTHTHCMSWVIYLKFLSTGKFVLIEYLTLIWLLYQLIIYAYSEANFRKKNIFLQIFLQFQIISVKRPDGPILMSGREQSCHTLFLAIAVRTVKWHVQTGSL